ncbi:flavin reductase [Gaiella sp.]|uniref:flavin reductase n=1 Tax=Gaiella sp. TaxID=2663207 RepID=UPI00326724B7
MSTDAPPPREFDVTLPDGFGRGEPGGLGESAFDDIPGHAPIDIGDLEGDPAIAFRRTLGMFATGVTVLTTRAGDHVHGMTANAFMSVSLRPPLVLISLDRSTRLCGMLHEGSRFGVSVLAQTQLELSGTYARSARDGVQPEFVVVSETALVQGALAHLVARVVRTYWGGDHSLFLGQVEYARYAEGEPLLFHGGRYERLLGDPELFSRLPPELLDQILLRGHEVRYAAGDTIMERGEMSDTMMLVKEGTVSVERPGRALQLGVGALVGEIEVLNPGFGRTATITAETDVTCVAVTRAALLEGFAADPAAAVALLGILASRFRER